MRDKGCEALCACLGWAFLSQVRVGDRIAPAAVTISPNGKMATYTDATGDTVQVTTTKGKFTAAQFIFDPNTAGQLTELALTGHSDFTGANILFTVFPVAGGSSAVNVGVRSWSATT